MIRHLRSTRTPHHSSAWSTFRPRRHTCPNQNFHPVNTDPHQPTSLPLNEILPVAVSSSRIVRDRFMNPVGQHVLHVNPSTTPLPPAPILWSCHAQCCCLRRSDYVYSFSYCDVDIRAVRFNRVPCVTLSEPSFIFSVVHTVTDAEYSTRTACSTPHRRSPRPRCVRGNRHKQLTRAPPNRP